MGLPPRELFSSSKYCVTTQCKDFPGGSVVKNLLGIQETACSVGGVSSLPGSGRSPGEGNGNQLQCSCLEHYMDRGAWWATVHGLTRVRHDLVTRPPPLHNPRLFESREKGRQGKIWVHRRWCVLRRLSGGGDS